MIFRWFRKDGPARVEPTTSSKTLGTANPQVMDMPDLDFFVGEAVKALGYVKPGATPTIRRLLETQIEPFVGESVDAYRKQGDQLSDDEKKARGIRKNAFMSKRAADDLTEKGWTKPLEAHAITVRRALFAWTRVRNIRQAQEIGCDDFKYDSVLDGVCPACDALDGKIVHGADALIFPPAGCVCETGRYVLHPEIDWLADLD